MIIGIWLLGPFFMFIEASFSGEWPACSEFNATDFWLPFRYPFISTFMMATYDGTLGALMITRIVSIVQSFRKSRRPPTEAHSDPA